MESTTIIIYFRDTYFRLHETTPASSLSGREVSRRIFNVQNYLILTNLVHSVKLESVRTVTIGLQLNSQEVTALFSTELSPQARAHLFKQKKLVQTRYLC